MKTKPNAIIFIIIVFLIAIINIPNVVNSFSQMEENGKTIDERIDDIEKKYNDGFAGKYKYVELNGLTNKYFGRQTINGTILLDNGYLTFKSGKCDLSHEASETVKLNEYLKNNNIDFSYVVAPFKNSPYSNNLPYGIVDYSNSNQDTLVGELMNSGVDTLDLRKQLQQDFNEDWYSAFFKTDHHWTPETGLWAYSKMSEYISQQYGYAQNKKSQELQNYNVDVKKAFFLGSEGKKTGQYVGGVDDLSIIYPKWETQLEVCFADTDKKREGSYRDTIFDETILVKDLYDVNQYTAYIGNSVGQCTIKNKAANNNKKLLIVRDSFSLVSAPYFAFMFKQVDLIDLRYYNEMSLKEYIDNTNPDVVLLTYCATTLQDDEVFEFGL